MTLHVQCSFPPYILLLLFRVFVSSLFTPIKRLQKKFLARVLLAMQIRFVTQQSAVPTTSRHICQLAYLFWVRCTDDGSISFADWMSKLAKVVFNHSARFLSCCLSFRILLTLVSPCPSNKNKVMRRFSRHSATFCVSPATASRYVFVANMQISCFVIHSMGGHSAFDDAGKKWWRTIA